MRFGIYIVIIVSLIIVGCGAGGDYTGIEYMPDMKHSRALETYVSSSVFADGKAAQLPAEGTIAQGFLPYHYENTTEDYERAGQEVRSPLNNIEHQNALAEGKNLYNIYCAVCHGKKGAANGTIVENGKYPPPPSYFREDILALSEGKMFHSVTHGKNLMGGYSSQLNQEERWQVISYIKDMQAKHIAKEQKISEEAALQQIFKGSGYISEAQAAAMEKAHAQPHHDDEYAGLKSLDELLAEHHAHGDDHGHGGGHGGHDDDAGHGASHGVTGKSKDSHGGHGHDEGSHEDSHHGEEHKDESHGEEHGTGIKDAIAATAIQVVDKVEATGEAVSSKLAEQFKSLDDASAIKSGQTFEMKNVLFATSKSTLKNSSTGDLKKLTELLVNNPNLRIELRGHTDSVGEDDINQELSQARAQEVANYLIKKSNIAADRIEVRGYGETQPVAPNDTPEGRQKNRKQKNRSKVSIIT